MTYKMKKKDWKNSVYPVRVEYGLYIIIYYLSSATSGYKEDLIHA